MLILQASVGIVVDRGHEWPRADLVDSVVVGVAVLEAVVTRIAMLVEIISILLLDDGLRRWRSNVAKRIAVRRGRGVVGRGVRPHFRDVRIGEMLKNARHVEILFDGSAKKSHSKFLRESFDFLAVTKQWACYYESTIEEAR